LLASKTKTIICENVSRNVNGELTFAGIPVSKLAKEYNTPLYLYDEDRIRKMCRTYLDAVRSVLGDKAQVLYASKAASFKRLYEIINDEGLGIDVVSSGEIFTANRAGFPLSRAYFHSNNKTNDDIRYAIEMGVGYFVVDNVEELKAISVIASDVGINQKILLRITHGIDPHTYAAVATGKVDSKFGSAIETGQAEEITLTALSLPAISLEGFHCHIGSQIFDSDIYMRAADVMMEFIYDIYVKTGFLARELDLGGGLGVRYIAEQPVIDIGAIIREVCTRLVRIAESYGIDLPKISFEPGRSIVADSGMTLYTVGTVKRIPGYKSYVSCDGGIADNPRFALYGSPYTIIPVMGEIGNEYEVCSVVGRCCESGDILQENVKMPKDMKRGDLIACLTTGAYHYSMSSNYNKLTRPPIVMLKDGESYVAVRRETNEHLAALEV
jgi:diaminopimelate decarboxylase